MKKLLLATTLLVGSTSFASAGEITFGGSAFMGLSNENTAATDFEFIARARISATLSGDTDSGLSFGAGFDLHNAAPAGTNQNNQGSATVYISGGFGKITMGDTGSAADNLIGNVSGVGLELSGDGWNELGYIGNQKTALKYEYSAGPWAVAVSAGQLTGNGEWSVAGKYTFADKYTVMLGYEDGGIGTTQTTLGVDAILGDATIKLRAVDYSSDPGGIRSAISVDYKFGQTTLTGYYAAWENGGPSFTDTYGIGASYDLGGGAAVKFGAESCNDCGGETFIDMGLKFSF